MGETGKGWVRPAPHERAEEEVGVGQERPLPMGHSRSLRGDLPQLPLTAPRAPRPGLLATRPSGAGPTPADTAHTTICLLFLAPAHPKAIAAFPTPTGRMWDFPGCEMQPRGALKAGPVTQPLEMEPGQYRRALASSCASSPRPGASEILHPLVFRPALNFATQEVNKLTSPARCTLIALEKQTHDFYFKNISFLSS